VITKSEEEEDIEEAVPEVEKLRKMAPQEYVDITLLPFPRRIKNILCNLSGIDWRRRKPKRR
jgi:hypothetical protein